MATVSKGQAMVERLEAFILRYVAVPGGREGGVGLVLAIWCLHTWLSERYTTTPYLVITAATKQAGKTLCMEVLGLLCRNPRQLATVRALAVVRMIEAFEGRVTFFFDEAEKLASSKAGDERSIMTSGYRVGGKHAITVGKSFTEFKTYASKCFALIGDLMDVLRDRSVVVILQRAVPVADFNVERAEAEGAAGELVKDVVGFFKELPALRSPEFLSGRDREIWTVLWSIAGALELDAATTKRLTRYIMDLTAAKSAPAKRFNRSAESEADAMTRTYSERALADLRKVVGAGEPGVWTSVAVERMKGLDDGPWRTFGGVGLSETSLAGLVGVHGVRPERIRMVVGKGARAAEQKRGYSRKVLGLA